MRFKLFCCCRIRQAVQPHQERSRRVDNTLTVWIQEAKNISAKKTYFCDLELDSSVHARTSRKVVKSEQKTGTVFWGEWFEFTHLPDIDVMTVNVYREADRKKKKEKNTMIGESSLSCNRVMCWPWRDLHVTLLLWCMVAGTVAPSLSHFHLSVSHCDVITCQACQDRLFIVCSQRIDYLRFEILSLFSSFLKTTHALFPSIFVDCVFSQDCKTSPTTTIVSEVAGI